MLTNMPTWGRSSISLPSTSLSNTPIPANGGDATVARVADSTGQSVRAREPDQRRIRVDRELDIESRSGRVLLGAVVDCLGCGMHLDETDLRGRMHQSRRDGLAAGVHDTCARRCRTTGHGRNNVPIRQHDRCIIEWHIGCHRPCLGMNDRDGLRIRCCACKQECRENDRCAVADHGCPPASGRPRSKSGRSDAAGAARS